MVSVPRSAQIFVQVTVTFPEKDGNGPVCMAGR